MALVICAQRQSILDEAGPILVTGGPGCGKTTIALAKAQRVIEAGLKPGQTVLFLSFSRAAVARVERYYTDTLMFDRYRQVYESALARNPGAA